VRSPKKLNMKKVKMENKFRKELAETAKRICRPGFGILAADESHGTLGKKFTPLNVENT